MKQFFKILFGDTRVIRHEELITLLKSQGLTFKEMNSRLSYGLIGHLIDKNGKVVVLIFPQTFYVRDTDLAINRHLLEVITLVREFYTDLSRYKSGYKKGWVMPPVILN